MAATTYHHVVVGSGVSGLTAALLLAKSGKKVLLVEKAGAPGGSLARFRIAGIPFDTGFHFTGGFSGDKLLCDMLRVLGLRDAIEPVFPNFERTNRFVLEPSGEVYDFPSGEDRLRSRLKAYFPGEETAVDGYLDRVDKVCRETRGMNLRGIHAPLELQPEDDISLQQTLDQLTGNRRLKTLLSVFCMCYGSSPAEISFANHARMCQGLYQSVARVKGGGETFIRAFKAAFAKHAVDLRCGVEVARWLDVRDGEAKRLLLTNGEEIAFESAILTIHPRAALALMPPEVVRPAFVNRVNGFEPSTGLFSVFGVFAERFTPDDCIVSLLPHDDVNQMLSRKRTGDSALVVIHNRETVAGRSVQSASAFEPSDPDETSAWSASSVGRRPADYYAYKARKVARIKERVEAHFGARDGDFQVLDAASTLTFRDYLHSPDGAAYGVRQKLGQYNVIGKLPLRNCYLAGQSALLPGIVGAMMSSFIVTRAMVDRAVFSKLIEQGLGD